MHDFSDGREEDNQIVVNVDEVSSKNVNGDNESDELLHSRANAMDLSSLQLKILSSCNNFTYVLSNPFHRNSTTFWKDFSILDHVKKQYEVSLPKDIFHVSKEEGESLNEFVQLGQEMSELLHNCHPTNILKGMKTILEPDTNIEYLNSPIFDELAPVNQRFGHEDEMICDIPSIFFKDNFSLEDEEIFGRLITTYNVSTSLQQQKLDYYYSIVESKILSEVTEKVFDFFSIHSSITSLEHAVDINLKQIELLKYDVDEISEILLHSPMEIERLYKEQVKLSCRMHFLNSIQSILTSYEYLLELERKNLVLESIDLIENLRGSLKDMTFITCLSDIQIAIEEKRKTVTRFLIQEALQKIKFSSKNLTTVLDLSLHPYFVGLLKLRSLKIFLTSHFEQIKSVISTEVLAAFIRKCVPQYKEGNVTIDKECLSKILKILSSRQFISCIETIFGEFEKILQHELTFAELVNSFAKEMHHCMKINVSTCNAIHRDVQSNFGTLYSLCHSRASIILSFDFFEKVLSRNELIHICNRINQFLMNTSRIINSIEVRNILISPLKDILTTYTSSYLQQTQHAKLKSLQRAVAVDKWIWVKENSNIQHVLDSYLPITSQVKNNEFVWINNLPFALSESAVHFSNLLLQYIDVMTKDSNDFFKPYQVCKYSLQLIESFDENIKLYILGAKASIQTGKAISVSHLVLASEILAYLVALTTEMENLFASRLDRNHSHLQQNFGHIIQNINSHRKIIFLKIEEIMKQIFIQANESWKKVAWTKEGLEVPTSAMKSISKYLKSFHAKLNQFQNERNKSQFSSIFTNVIEYYVEKIKDCISTILSDSMEKEVVIQRLKVDIKEFEQKLKSCEEFIIVDPLSTMNPFQNRLSPFLQSVEMHLQELKD